jgi:beta-catenin-like protein 1
MWSLTLEDMQASKKPKSGTVLPASEDTGHVLGILSSLFSNLASDSSSRIRLLAKFVENDYEKVDKLLELRDNAQNRLKIVDAEIDKEKTVRVSLHS